jgi:type IX secretion system PorP/SprF family membrane protein
LPNHQFLKFLKQKFVMKKFILTILAVSTLIVSAYSQDEAIFSHYLINPMLVNPAYAGFNDKVQLFGHMRNQWSGFENAPKTYALTLDLPMTEKVGLGALILSEKIGMEDRFRAQANYAYRYVGKGYKWSIGFSTEFYRSKLAASINDPTANPLVDRNDPLVIERIKGITYFDATFGATALINDKIVLSLSTPNLIRQRLGATDPANSPRSTFKQFILMGGYRIKKNQVTFEPSLQIHKVFASPFEVDVNLKAIALEEKLIAAIQVRPGDSGQIGFLVGTKQPSFSLFYSYNNSLATFNTYARNSHEITLGIAIQKADKTIDRGNKRYRN